MDSSALSRTLHSFLTQQLQQNSLFQDEDILSAVVTNAIASTMDTAAAASAEGDPAGILSTTCQAGNDFNGNMPARISSIFVILVAGAFGALFPVISSKASRLNIPPVFFFMAKYFGSGVIVSTALIHLMQPGSKALSSPCLGPGWNSYPFAYGIALFSIFGTFLVELLSRRYLERRGITHSHGDSGFERADDGTSTIGVHPTNSHHHQGDLENQLEELHHTHTHSDFRNNSNRDNVLNGLSPIGPKLDSKVDDGQQVYASTHSARSSSTSTVNNGIVEVASAEEDEIAMERNLAMQLGSIFILEFGIIFHSVFIGLSLAVSGPEFTSLYIVLVFHQLFEGLGLGTRIAVAPWPQRKSWIPWVLCVAFALTTPIAICIGLGVRHTYPPGSHRALVTNGIFDSISAGILLYVGLVELIGSEFLHNEDVQKAGTKKVLFAYGCMCAGAALMALLAKWV